MKTLFQLNSIRKRILFGFSIVLILVIMLGSYNHLAISAINKNTNQVIDRQLPILILEKQMAQNMSVRISLVRGYIIFGDTENKKEYDLLTEEAIQMEEEWLKLNGAPLHFDTFTKESVEIKKELLNLSDPKESNALISKKIKWGETLNRVFKEYESGNKQKAIEILGSEVKPLDNDILSGLNGLALKRVTTISKLGKYIQGYGDNSLRIELFLTIVIVGISVWVALHTARKLSRPIEAVMNRMKAIAAGDFSQDALMINSKDEIGQLALATNEMTDSTRNLLYRINTVSETVLSHSEELTQAANEVKVGTGQISTTMEELATGTETQAGRASDLAAHMEIFKVKVDEAHERGEEIQGYSEKVLDMTQRGSQLMKSSTSQMNNINSIVSDAMTKMQKLDAESQKISTLVSVIKDISEQTNLLALNAAIEAARAGEQGSGFAVVANEVRKLSEQVALSVTDITALVNNIKTESSLVVSSLRDGYDEVAQGTIQLSTTDETFSEINSAVNEMVQGITTVSQYLSEVVTSSKEMNESIEEMASISEEAAAGVEQTAASAQQASSSMEEVADSSEHLAKLSEELRELVNKFKL